jgi:O-antigen biosynthesis protein WbqP
MSKTMKRWIDFVLSLGGILVLSPLLIFISLWIKLDSKGPVFFTQKRVGINKTTFMIYKFRTMRTDTPKDTPTHLLDDPNRFITKSGAFLRKTSLDELPQLFNILFGQMAVVGPRPALWNQYDLIDVRDKFNANDVRPGLTGWAQINGRDELPIEVKAKLDGDYVQRMSLLFDAEIFIKTFFSVLKSDGVKEGNDARKGGE